MELDGISYDAKFLFDELGFNVEPSEMGAAFGLVQLGKLEQNITAREQNFRRHYRFFSQYEEWFVMPRQMQSSRTGWLAFALTIRDNAPFDRRQLQIWLEERDVQTRPVFTGNILRQPAMRAVTSAIAPGGYPIADEVMRGGILLACHHGLEDDQISYMHGCFEDFAKTLSTSPACETAHA